MPDLATTRRESLPAIALRALRHPATALGVARFVGTVLKDFFALQFAVKLGLRRVPVVDVDHPLDARIPFTPERIATYLDFISFGSAPSVGSPATTARGRSSPTASGSWA